MNKNKSAKTCDCAVSFSIQMSGKRASFKPTLPSMEVAAVTVQEVRNAD